MTVHRDSSHMYATCRGVLASISMALYGQVCCPHAPWSLYAFIRHKVWVCLAARAKGLAPCNTSSPMQYQNLMHHDVVQPLALRMTPCFHDCSAQDKCTTAISIVHNSRQQVHLSVHISPISTLPASSGSFVEVLLLGPHHN